MEIEPLTATIGAEIGGVDLASPLSDDMIAAIAPRCSSGR